MSDHFNLIESDSWPVLKPKIVEERAKRIGDLLYVTTIDALRQQQGFVEALNWVLDQAKPPQPTREDDDDC